MKRTVHFVQEISVTVTVDVPDDAHHDAVIEAAYNAGPSSLCVQCSGYSQQWDRDDSGELAPFAITDESGEEIWTERPIAELTGDE